MTRFRAMRKNKIPTKQGSICDPTRFISNIRQKDKQTGQITCNEMENSKKILVRNIQQEIFTEEIQALTNKSHIRNSALKELTPFIDDENILRVGGRLRRFNASHRS